MKKLLGLILAVVMIASCFSVALADEIPEAHLNWLSWMTKGEDEPTVKTFMEKYPQVKVEVMAIDGTNYATDLITRCLGGDVPDVFLANTNAINELVANGFIQPIDGLAGVDRQLANPGVQESHSRDGKTYGFAINGAKGGELYYYNKAMFAEAGVEVPTTWEELEAVCAKLKEAGFDPLITPAGDTWNANYFVNAWYRVSLANNGFSKNVQLGLLKGDIKLSDLYTASFHKMKEWYDNGWISEGGLSMGWEAGTQYFVDGGAAMICTGNWLPGSTPIQEAPEDFEFGAFVMDIPAEDGKRYNSISTDRSIFLSANPSSPEAAKALFEYFISDEVLYEYLTRQGLTGVNIDVPVADVFQGPMDTLNGEDYVLTMTDLSMNDMPSGYIPNLSQYSADVFSGADVEELLAKLDADFDAAMSTVDVDSYIAAIEAK